MQSNQYPNHPREGHARSDGVQTVDPLSQFPPETSAEQPVKGNHALNTGTDAPSLLPFKSEKTLKEAASRSPHRGDRAVFSEWFSVVRSRLVLAWSFVVRAAQHHTLLVKAVAVRASVNPGRLSVRAVKGCQAVALTLCARSRAGFSTVSSTPRHAIGRLRERDPSGALDARHIANAELVSLWRVLCFRAAATANQLRGQLRVAGRRASLLAPPSSRRRMVQMHPWTYPVGVFFSGVAVGASLMIFERTPSDRSVPAVAAVVSAKQAAAPPSSVGDLIATTPSRVVFADAPRPTDHPVPKSGIGSPARPRAPRVREEPRATVAPRQSEAFEGALQISSRPAGAAVFMNGRQVGTTPLVLQDLPIGSRVVRLTLAGYEPWSRAVQVVAHQRTTLAAALQASRSE